MKEELIQELMKYKKSLIEMLQKTKTRNENAPKGSLIITSNKRSKYYHLFFDELTDKWVRKYLKKEDLELVHLLAQKNYDLQLMKAAKRQLDAIEKFLTDYHQDAVKNIYSKLSDERRNLIEPEDVDDETYAAKWESIKYSPGMFDERSPELYTAKKERVRSKSEKIIADMLYEAGIPYRYEYPMRFPDGRTIRPDFLILNKRTRKVYILEHLGMLDNADYCNRALAKIQSYIQAGIYPGESLILTAETTERPFSSVEFEQIINHYFI